MKIIYKITNQVNNKVYIGKTTRTIEERFKEHVCEFRHFQKTNKCFKGYNSRLYPAMSKYGIDNFKIEVVEFLSDDEDINEKEKEYIKLFNSTDSKIGYNISEGGLGGNLFQNHKHSISTKNKISNKQKDKKWYNNGNVEIMILKTENPPKGFNKGRLKGQGFKSGTDNPSFLKRGTQIGPMKEETKIKLSNTKKLNNSKKKKVWYNNGVSEIQIDLNSDYLIPKNYIKGRLSSHIGKKKAVIQFDILTNKKIKEFESLSSAEKETNISAGSILACCTHRTKTAGGYKWEYVD